MDELFGVGDMSNVEDIGLAGKQPEWKQDSYEVEEVHNQKA
jgi:hypothetical protein